jgi:hypothetical protein
MIVEKQMECRLAGETEVLGEKMPDRRIEVLHAQFKTIPDPRNTKLTFF